MSAVGHFRELIASRFGLKFEEARFDFLDAVLERRAQARGTSLPHYMAALATDETETAALGTELTVGETYFFRNFEQFAALAGIIIAGAAAFAIQPALASANAPTRTYVLASPAYDVFLRQLPQKD